jgi:UDP-glucose 4-epimerase
MFYDMYGLETITFRYFNVYGERQPTKGQYAPVIGLFQKQHEEGLPMTIVGDGKQTRDFTYVGDVVDANIKAATTENPDAFGEIFNIGTGNSYNIFDLVKMVGGDDAKYEFIPERLAEIRDSKANTDKAKNILGWQYKTKLEDWITSCKQQLA